MTILVLVANTAAFPTEHANTFIVPIHETVATHLDCSHGENTLQCLCLKNTSRRSLNLILTLASQSREFERLKEFEVVMRLVVVVSYVSSLSTDMTKD